MSAYPETLVARVVGVKKKRLAALRGQNLARGADWLFEDPRVGVTYTDAGLKKLLGLLGLDAAALRWPAEATPSAEPAEPAPAETGASAATEQAAHVEIEASEMGEPDAGAVAFMDYGSAPLESGHEPLVSIIDAPTDPAPEKIVDPAPAGLPPGAPPAVNPPHEPAAADVVAQVEERVEDLAQAEEARELVELRVTKLPINPRILFAVPSAGGAEVRVRVKSNANFVKGMLLRARAPADESEVFCHVGNCPRRRGHY